MFCNRIQKEIINIEKNIVGPKDDIDFLNIILKQHLQNYEIVDIIGRGGFGTVFDIKLDNTKENIAIKITHEKLKSITKNSLPSELIFNSIKEAKTILYIRRKYSKYDVLLRHIVEIYDILPKQEFDNNICHVYEYIDSDLNISHFFILVAMKKYKMDLKNFMKYHLKESFINKAVPNPYLVPSSPIWITNVIKAISIILYFIKKEHIIHFDLKPENIFLDFDQTIVIADFGCNENPNKPSSCYTTEYAAPEVKAGTYTDSRADIYSFGKIIQKMIYHYYEIVKNLQDNIFDRFGNFLHFIKTNNEQPLNLCQLHNISILMIKGNIEERPYLQDIFLIECIENIKDCNILINETYINKRLESICT